MMSRSDIVLRLLIGQRRQLVRPCHAVIAWRWGMRSGWLGLVLYEQWKLNDGPQVVVAIDTGFVELTVEVVF